MTCDETIAEAHHALERGDYNLAEKLYRDVLSREGLQEQPEDIRALDGLGVIMCQKGETEQGIALFEQALDMLRTSKTEPQSDDDEKLARWETSLLFHLGLSYRTLGRQQEALKVFTDASVIALRFIPAFVAGDNTLHRDLVLNLGQLYFDLEQYPQAAEQFRTLTEIEPDNASAWLTLGYVLSMMDRHDEAAAVLRTAETLDSTSPEICLYLAESLRKAERYAESLPYYQKMLQVGDQYPQAVHGYGKTLLALGDLEQGWEGMEFRFLTSVGNWERHKLPNWMPEVGCRPPGGTVRHENYMAALRVARRLGVGYRRRNRPAVGCLPNAPRLNKIWVSASLPLK